MKSYKLKILLTLFILLLGAYIINTFFDNRLVYDMGSVELTIIDDDGITLYSDNLSYDENESLFDALNHEFMLTCATYTYENDQSCSYTFNLFGLKNHVILGIKSDSFDIMTDWNHTFIKIYVYDDKKYIEATSGFDYIQLDQYQKIKLVVEKVGT